MSSQGPPNMATQHWPDGGLETLGRCPVCDAVPRDLLFEGLSDVTYFVAPGSWTMWRCRSCRAAYLDPRPTPETIGIAYGRYYTHAVAADEAGPPVPLPPHNLRSGLRALFALGDGYKNARYGTRRPRANPLGHLLGRLYWRIAWRSDYLFRFLPKAAPGAPAPRVLDVGCGGGEFLVQAREIGWEPYGIDFDPLAVRAAQDKGFQVSLGGIEDLDDTLKPFDAATLSHVIEHVYRPVDTLTAIHARLRPGGHFYVETPNIDAIGRKRYGLSWRGFEAPRHLVMFDAQCLRDALARAGFVNIRQRRVGHEELSRLSGSIAAGIDPYSDEAKTTPKAGTLFRLRAATSRKASDYLLFTAQRASA